MPPGVRYVGRGHFAFLYLFQGYVIKKRLRTIGLGQQLVQQIQSELEHPAKDISSNPEMSDITDYSMHWLVK